MSLFAVSFFTFFRDNFNLTTYGKSHIGRQVTFNNQAVINSCYSFFSDPRNENLIWLWYCLLCLTKAPMNENTYPLNTWILHHMYYNRAINSFRKLVNFQKNKIVC